MTILSGAVYVGGVLAACVLLFVAFSWRTAARHVDTLDERLRRRIDGEDPVDAHAAGNIRRFALAPYAPDSGEPSQLLREIYAAQHLYRDGVDIFARAPKEN